MRGYVQNGELRLFQGVAFTLPERTGELLSRLRQISHKLKLDKKLPAKVTVYGPSRTAHLCRLAVVDSRRNCRRQAAASVLANGESVA